MCRLVVGACMSANTVTADAAPWEHVWLSRHLILYGSVIHWHGHANTDSQSLCDSSNFNFGANLVAHNAV